MAKAKKPAKRPAGKPKKPKPSAPAPAVRKAKAEPATKKRPPVAEPSAPKISKTISLPRKAATVPVASPADVAAPAVAKIIKPATPAPASPPSKLVKAAAAPTAGEPEPPPAPRAPEPPPRPDPKLIDRMLRTAIADKRLVRLTYNKVSRIVEPHDYGVRKGVTILLAYQPRLAGAQVSPEAVEGWRWFNVEKIAELFVLKESFPGSRGEQHTQHNTWDAVHARVA